MIARLASILLCASASVAFADSLTVVVRGAVDGKAVRDQLARELATDVALVDDCRAPCVEVAVSGRKASVAFTPRTGEPRARMIDLGSDRSQWPLVITLLAGNIVRDEAADLLAQLPIGPVAPAPAPAPAPDPEPEAVVEEADAEAAMPPPTPPFPMPLPIPAIAPAPPVLEGDPARESMLLSVGLVPGLSTDWTHVGRVHHVLSVDLLVGVSGGSSLLTLSGIADIERGDVWGFQLAGVVAVARRVDGIQGSGIAATSGDLNGVQLAGVAAVADRVEGLQVGGITTVARRRGGSQIAGIAAVSGRRSSIQLAGIATYTDGPAGVQVGGVAAVARGKANIQLAGIAVASNGDANIQIGGISAAARGDTNIQLGGIAVASNGTANIQAAGVATYARTGNIQIGGVASVAGSANVQVAGVVNVARKLRGVQVAPINVAREVEGVQVGLINVGGSADGFSFGLINIVPGGRADLEAAVDSGSVGTVLFRHGGNRWHNVYGIGGHPVDESGPSDDVWMYGLGFGPSWRVSHTRIDLEAIGWQVNHGARHSTDVSILGQLRLTLAHGIGPFAVIAGGALNAYVSDDHSSPLLLERRAPGTVMERDVTVEVWPSFFAGVRI